jgi:hypothetical protein
MFKFQQSWDKVSNEGEHAVWFDNILIFSMFSRTGMSFMKL